MKEIDFAYLPVIGRGEQIHIICALHNIKINMLNSTPMGADFELSSDSLFGTVPWIRDKANGLVLNDSMAIVQYLVNAYEGPLTPQSTKNAAEVANLWAWCNDYYSFVLSPLHDIITGHNETFWRNLRLTDTLVEGGKELATANLKTLHQKRVNFLESHLTATRTERFMLSSNCSYADVFLYTCVRSVQKCKGFGDFRNEFAGDPFEGKTNILEVCDEVENLEKIGELVGSKFDECPI